MLILSIILFALAAVFGVLNISAILQNKNTSKPVVYTHGILAALALVLTIVYAINNPSNAPTASIIIFVVAALGGFILFFRDMAKKPGPKGLALIHGAAAVIAFVLLIVFALNM